MSTMPECLYCQATTENVGELVAHLATSCEPFRSFVRHDLEFSEYLAERTFRL